MATLPRRRQADMAATSTRIEKSPEVGIFHRVDLDFEKSNNPTSPIDELFWLEFRNDVSVVYKILKDSENNSP